MKPQKAVLLVPALVILTHASLAEAGVLDAFRKSRDCSAPTERCREPICREECCPPKKRCCLIPKEPPKGEVAFSIPGVIRPGQALQISDEAVRRGIQHEASRDIRRQQESAGERTDIDRVDRLEKDVAKLTDLTLRLTTAVEAINQKLNDNENK